MTKDLIHKQILDLQNKVNSLRPIINAWGYDKFSGGYSVASFFDVETWTQEKNHKTFV